MSAKEPVMAKLEVVAENETDSVWRQLRASAEAATRAIAYVGVTRGRHTNTVRLYDTRAGEADHEHADPTAAGVHAARRGTPARRDGCRLRCPAGARQRHRHGPARAAPR